MLEEQLTTSIQDRVIDLISTGLKVDREKIKPNSRFIDDLGADSLDQVELVMALEEEFELEIGDDEAEKFQTVQQVVDYISQKSAH